MNREGIAYDTVLAVHIVAGFIGFGAMGVSGWFAAQARRRPGSEAVRRYFRPGTNWVARAVYLVPLSGLALLYMGGNPGSEAGEAWVVAGVVIWCVATGMAVLVLWPAEKELAHLLGTPPPDTGRLGTLSRRVGYSAAVVDVAYVAAVWLMVAKPH